MDDAVSAAADFDEDSDDRLKASFGAIARYVVRRWIHYPVRFTAFSLLTLASVACDLALPIVSSGLVEALSAGSSAEETAWGYYWLFAFVALGLYTTRNTSVRFWIPIAAGNMKSIVDDGFRDVQRFSADWHANNFAGATVRRVSRAMSAYDVISDTLMWFVVPSVLVLGGVTIITAMRWPLIGAFVGATIVAMIAISYWSSRYYLAEDYLRANDADTKIGAALADAVGGNGTVKSFGAEEREQERMDAITSDWRVKSERLWRRGTDVWVAQNLVLLALQAGLLGLVMLEWSAGRATAGSAVFAITAFLLVSGYLRTMGESVRNLQKGFADISDVVAYAANAADIVDHPEARAFTPAAGEIIFKDVVFSYQGQPAPLYDRFSLTVAPGETLALVGPTGAGKSTFVKLVQRLYDVASGAILVDGQDVRTVTQSSLRRAIAVVPQDPALFHRSLHDNIAYARPDASDAEIEAAARRARAHDFIARLPKGYATEVGERGVKLSGGERQRVALARAFLADAPILILDEATSSLDNETERDVQAAMAELMLGRTTIVIAHRLSTIRSADRILVFDRGRVVEQGTHTELLRHGGLYAKLAAVAGREPIAAQ